MGRISAAEVARYAKGALGADNDGLTTAVAVGLAESGGKVAGVAYADTEAVNRNSNGTTDTGIWQINSVHRARHPTWTTSWLKVPENNAQAMAAVSNNGTNWQPWVAFKNGRYRAFWEEAAAAAGSSGSVGLPNPGDVVGAAADAAMALPNAIQNLAQAFVDTVNKVGSWMAEPHNWQRVGFVVGGALLVVLAGSAVASDTKAGQAIVGAATSVGPVRAVRPAARRR